MRCRRGHCRGRCKRCGQTRRDGRLQRRSRCRRRRRVRSRRSRHRCVQRSVRNLFRWFGRPCHTVVRVDESGDIGANRWLREGPVAAASARAVDVTTRRIRRRRTGDRTSSVDIASRHPFLHLACRNRLRLRRIQCGTGRVDDVFPGRNVDRCMGFRRGSAVDGMFAFAARTVCVRVRFDAGRFRRVLRWLIDEPGADVHDGSVRARA